MSWPNSTDNKAKKKSFALTKSLAGSSTQIWKSRLSWRIALWAVFVPFLVIQFLIVVLRIPEIRQQELNQINEEGRSAIVSVIQKGQAPLGTSPIEEIEINDLLKWTNVEGVAIYSNSDGQLIRAYGEPATLKVTTTFDNGQPKFTVPKQNIYRHDNSYYDVIYPPRQLGGSPYNVIASLDARNVEKAVQAYLQESFVILILSSALVTVVLMIYLGPSFLEPILFMRQNLIEASENPENPRIQESPYNSSEEIGGAILIAQKLIKQNAENIRRIKSAAEDQIHKLAYFDSLTGLPNRTSFIEHLKSRAAESDEDNPTRFAVIALDIDHFKDINDSMGHAVGDHILRGFGKRLRSAMPESAIVARFGQDEFAIAIALTKDIGHARSIADKIASVIRAEPFKAFSENFQVRSSIGVATFPDDGTDPDQVLKNADIALNRAKEEGRDTVKEYSEDFDRAVQQRFQMLRDLRDAIEHDQLLLHYQPQFDLKSGKIIGAEALLRWWKPDNSKEGGHYISPGDFIPIAEQSGLIVPIGEWVLQTACETAAAWQQAGHDLRIAVNVSGVQFYKSDLIAVTDRILRETGLEPRQLELEVTESVFMEDVNFAIQTLQNLHGLGVELAIDDFGTGYSSLSYLRQFPIDRLKIDQSFIRNALNNPDDAAIARTIVRLGHSLNLKVIAEGVETKEHEDFLLAEECDEVQGFRYSKPIIIDDFNAFLESYSGNLQSFG